MRILLTESWLCLVPRELQPDVSGSARRPARWASGALFESPGGVVGREKPSMFSLKWLQSRGANRGKPGLPGGHGRRLVVLGALCAASLLQTGCQSGPFSPCGFVGRTTSRIMRPFRNGGAEACCGAEAGGCVTTGVPVESIAPGTGTVVVPGPSAPSSVDTPQYLESVPKASPGPAPSGPTGRAPAGPTTGSKTSSSYETLRPETRSARSRADNLANSLVSTPVPAMRSAQDFSKPDATAARDDGDSILDHLPPLDLPSDVADKSLTPPVPPAAQRKPQTSATASDHVGGRSPLEPELTLTGTRAAAGEPASPPPAPSSSAPATGPGATPGIARFAAVDLKLAGGSVPSTPGLDWLSDKGYKTLVDLRESSQANLELITAATERGFRYVALPVSAKTIDRDHLARFNFELSLADARPLYFFDGDGTRAGTFWYLRRVLVDHVNPQIARREAADLGLSDETFWAAATAYLDRQGPAQSASTDALGQAAPTTSEKAVVSPPKSENPPREGTTGAKIPKAATPTVAPTSASRAADTTLVAHDRAQEEPGTTALGSQSSPAVPVEPASWRPLAGMVITGLTFPLAYWGRTYVPTLLAMTQASLPGPARRPKSLPHASDA
jgi:protein tyrosine phosphatase (PTP) superfamily phosphohydrolase (DUF442 family)